MPTQLVPFPTSRFAIAAAHSLSTSRGSPQPAMESARYAHLARESMRESAIRISDSIAADILKGYRVEGGHEAPAGTAT